MKNLLSFKDTLDNFLSLSGKKSEASTLQDHLIESIHQDIAKVHFQYSRFLIHQMWHSIDKSLFVNQDKWVNAILRVSRLNWETPSELPIICKELIGTITRHSLFLLHTTINKSIHENKKENELTQLLENSIEDKEELYQLLKAELVALEKLFDKKLLVFYQLNLSEHKDSFAVAATQMSTWVNQKLIFIGSITNFLSQFIIQLQKDNKRSFSEKIGTIATKYGFLSRQLIAAQAGIWKKFLSHALGIPSSSKTVYLPFDIPQLPNGKNMAIHQLKKAKEKAFVETGGFVQQLESFRTHDKSLVCRALLYDPSSRKSVFVVVPFVHLRHLGIEIGAYLVINGYLNHTSNLAQGATAIHIDRLPLSEMKKKSWKIQLLDEAKEYYQAWYSGLNIAWSLSQQIQSNKHQRIDKMGAGELLYQPLYRGAAFDAYRKEKYSKS